MTNVEFSALKRGDIVKVAGNGMAVVESNGSGLLNIRTKAGESYWLFEDEAFVLDLIGAKDVAASYV